MNTPMLPLLVPILSLGMAYIAVAMLVARKVGGHYLTPHGYWTLNQLVPFVLAPAVQVMFAPHEYTMSGLFRMNGILAFWYLAYTVGFLSPTDRIARGLHRIIGPLSVSFRNATLCRVHIVLLLAAAGLCFMLMAELSGLGTLHWLLNPRQGYQDHRGGVGLYYVLSSSLFNFSYCLILFHWVRSRSDLIKWTLLFALGSYFWGSKGGVIGVIFGAMLYYNYFVKRLRIRHILLLGLLLLGVFAVLMWAHFALLYQSSVDALELLRYFNHYTNGYAFFVKFHEKFQFLFGEELVSSLWDFVPRAMYDQKPHVYGINKYVLMVFFGGILDGTGNGPAFGGPVSAYLNFGLVGVGLQGLMLGWVASLHYRYFLRYQNVLGFILMARLAGFSVVVLFSNLFVTLAFCGLQAIVADIHVRVLRRTKLLVETPEPVR